MQPYPREDYRSLARYLPDRSPIAVDLSDNRNLWGAHPDAIQALRESMSGDAANYPDAYGDPLIEAVCGRLSIASDCVATGVGGTGVLDNVMRAAQPTTMRFLDPGWPAASMLARMNGHEPTGVPFRAGLDDPRQFVGDEASIVFVANPNNPTGDPIPDAWIREVHRRTEEVGSILILDEAYGEFARDLNDRMPFDLALASERTLCVKTTSKAYGLAGMRAGYAVAAPGLVLEVDKARGPFSLTRVSAKAAAAAISSSSPWLEETVAATRENRDRLIDSLVHRGFTPPPSAANFVFVPFADAEAVQDAAAGLQRAGVRTRPFSSPAAGGTGLRATVGPWDMMQRLLDALDLLASGDI